MLFITIVLSLPVYGLAIWGLYDPEEAILFLDKWRYKDEPEFSDLQMKLFKLGNIFTIILMSIFIIFIAVDTFTPEPEMPTQNYQLP